MNNKAEIPKIGKRYKVPSPKRKKYKGFKFTRLGPWNRGEETEFNYGRIKKRT